MSRHDAGMEGYSGPGDPLHERHGGETIEVRLVPPLSFDDTEYARWRPMIGGAGGDFGVRDGEPVAIHRQPLVMQRDDDVQRALRPIESLRGGRSRIRLATGVNHRRG